MSRAALHAGIVVMVAAAGCAGTKRTPEAYRDATKQLMDTRDAEIKACYDKVLAGTPKVSGTVTVKFVFEPDSGKLANPAIDRDHTTAPEPIAQCVLTNLANLALTPADKRRGEATWSWAFEAPSA